MTRTCSVFTLLLVAVAGAWIGGGTFLHELVVTMLVKYLGPPLSIIALVYAACISRWKGWNSMVPALWVVGVGVSLHLSWLVGHEWLQHDLASAREFPWKVKPIVKAYQAANGSLPEHISDIPNMPGIPRLLRVHNYNGEYKFSFKDSSKFIDMGAWEFDEVSNDWTYIDD